MSQFSWDDPGVTNLLDAYIHNTASGSGESGDAPSPDPNVASARAIAKVLMERYGEEISRHMVHHQIKKRRRLLNGDRNPSATPMPSTGTQSQSRRSGRLRGSPPPESSSLNNTSVSQPTPISTKKAPKSHGIPQRAAKTARRPHVPTDADIRNEVVLTLRRFQALMDAQTTLAANETAYYNRRNQGVAVFDLNEDA